MLYTKSFNTRHVVGKFAMLHSYRKGIAFQKCYFNSSKQNSLIGRAVNQFDTPFSMLILEAHSKV